LAGTGTVYLTPRIPPSPKPFGCPPVVGQGLTESAPPGRPRVRQPSKKSKGSSRSLLPPRCGRYTARELIAPAAKVLLLNASLSEVSLPREEQSRLIFPGWLPFGEIWQWDFVKPAVRAWENPTGGLHSERASRGNPASSSRTPVSVRTCHELQVHVTADYPFERFGDLTVEPPFQPRYSKAVGYENQSGGICHLYQRCSGKPVFCLSER
jgi:hypothetical protein